MFKENTGVTNLTLYIKGQNTWIYVFDKNLTFDPESNVQTSNWEGKGLYNYTSPIMRSLSFGMSIDF
jgi:hypothetical protein